MNDPGCCLPTSSCLNLTDSSGKLSLEAIQVVFEELRKKGMVVLHLSLCCLVSDSFQPRCRVISGNLEWQDKNKSRCLVMWRRPEEWAKFIYQWVSVRSEELLLNPH